MLRELRGLWYQLRFVNRRRYPRLEAAGKVSCLCSCKKEGTAETFLCIVVDVSRAGALVMTSERKFYPKAKITLIFNAPFCPEGISLEATVVRTYRKHDQNWYFSGVRFPDPDDPALLRLVGGLAAAGAAVKQPPSRAV